MFEKGFLNRSSAKFSIAIDVGSSRVVGALVRKAGGQKPEIWYTSYADIAFQEQLEIFRYGENILSALENCLKDLGRHLDGMLPTEAIVTLSSLLYEGKLSAQSKVFTEDTRVTKALLQSVAGPAEKPVTEATLEDAIIQVRLNGYPTANPIGQSARTIDTVSYVSVGDPLVQKRIRETVAHAFRTATVRIHSFSFVAFAVLRNLILQENFVCIDFGGEITDIIVVKRGVLEKTISVPFGKNHILREVMRSMHVSYDIAASSLKLFHEGNLHQTVREQIQQALEVGHQRWDTLFIGTLEHVTLDSLLPQDVYILGNPALVPIIISYVQAERYNRYVFVGQPFRAHELSNTMLQSICSAKSQSTVLDPFVVISSVFSATLIPIV